MSELDFWKLSAFVLGTGCILSSIAAIWFCQEWKWAMGMAREAAREWGETIDALEEATR